MPTKTNLLKSKIFSKLTKWISYVMMFILILSGMSFDKKPLDSSTLSYDYNIHAAGSVSKDFKGVIDFETAVEMSPKGIPFSTLKLKFSNKENALQHSFEFLIAKQNTKENISDGRYKIERNKSSLLHHFDGVFGFANVDALGELPLFAKEGEIRIYELNQFMLEGDLDVVLSNSNGQVIHLKGNFLTKKENDE